MNIFSLKSILNSYCFETDSFHNLIFLLTNNKINSEFEINSDILFLLEEPLRTLDYSSIENSNELEEYTKIELNMIVNKLLEERSAILSFYEISNKERKVFKRIQTL